VGRGPRGYQRSDDRIRDDVCELLSRHGRIDAREIDVEVENGEVTLTGFVESRAVKRMAEDVAESAPGVRDVHNQIRVRGAAPPEKRRPTGEPRPRRVA
jgi:osmotically-inducible protein OsmY